MAAHFACEKIKFQFIGLFKSAQPIVSLYREIATSAHKGLLAMTRYFFIPQRTNFPINSNLSPWAAYFRECRNFAALP